MAESNDKVSRLTKYGFGTGHMLNDIYGALAATYWFLFFTSVIGLSNVNAGVIVVAGQVSDGVAQIVVGVLLDKSNNFWLCVHYGKRKVLKYDTMISI